MRNILFLAMTTNLSFGCGNYEPPKDGAAKSKAEASAPAPVVTPSPVAPMPGSTATPDASQGKPADTVVHGFEVSAFNVTVNGTAYTNLSDFYSQKLTELQIQADAENLGAVAFDAQVGYQDLGNGSTAFVASEGGVAYSSSAEIRDDGSFDFTLPAGVSKAKIVTVKRLSVTIHPSKQGAQPIFWCLDFLSTPKSIDLDQ